MAYVKLFSEILDSTVWREEPPTKLVWITMLAMANRDGEVMASIPGLADRARVPMSDCLSALARLMAPDEYSRTKEHEGRRIAEIDGGWVLLNYEKFRLKMSREESNDKAAVRMAKWRERNKLQTTVTPVTSDANYDIASPSPEASPGSEKIRSVPKARVYASEFEVFWSGCVSSRRKGEKPDAEDAWKAAGRPAAAVLLKLWDAYRASLGETPPKDVCRWLKNGRWQGPYEAAPPPPVDRRPQWQREATAPAPYHAPAKPAQADWSQIAPWPKGEAK